MRVHLDTDFAGDTDDAAALALILGWPDALLTGVTTVADPLGARAGYANTFLSSCGRSDVAVIAGAGASLAGADMGGLPDHEAYWGTLATTPVTPDPDRAADAIAAAVGRGDTVLAIGPLTNLALAERRHPGTLASSRVVVMGGWVDLPDADLPPWGPEFDWNLQTDPDATDVVLRHAGDLTLVTLPATLRSHLRLGDVERLQGLGRVGALLARQALAHRAEHGLARLAADHPGIPADLCNFQYDPVAAAVALGWTGARCERRRLRIEGPPPRIVDDPDGREVSVVVAVDSASFATLWLECVARV